MIILSAIILLFTILLSITFMIKEDITEMLIFLNKKYPDMWNEAIVNSFLLVQAKRCFGH